MGEIATIIRPGSFPIPPFSNIPPRKGTHKKVHEDEKPEVTTERNEMANKRRRVTTFLSKEPSFPGKFLKRTRLTPDSDKTMTRFVTVHGKRGRVEGGGIISLDDTPEL